MTFFFLAEPVGATSQQQHGAHLDECCKADCGGPVVSTGQGIEASTSGRLGAQVVGMPAARHMGVLAAAWLGPKAAVVVVPAAVPAVAAAGDRHSDGSHRSRVSRLGKERRLAQEAGSSPYRLFCERSREVREGKAPRAPHSAGSVDSSRLPAQAGRQRAGQQRQWGTREA